MFSIGATLGWFMTFLYFPRLGIIRHNYSFMCVGGLYVFLVITSNHCYNFLVVFFRFDLLAPSVGIHTLLADPLPFG